MSRIPLLPATVTLLFIVSACEEPLDLNLPEPSPRLVVISNFTNDREIQVYVSKTQSVLDNSPGEYIPDARVDLFQGDAFLERLTLIRPSNRRLPPYYATRQVKAAIGLEYTIRVEVNGFEPTTARSSIPPLVRIEKFSLEDVLKIPLAENLTRYVFTVSLGFDDPDEEHNYYHLNFYQQIQDYVQLQGDTLIVDTYEVPVQFDRSGNQNTINAYFSGGLLLEDDPRDGDYTFSFLVDLDPNRQLLGQVFAELRSISRDYYLYHNSLSHLQNSSENPFSEPVIIYNNIENGKGIFAGYSSDRDSLRVLVR